MSEKTVYERPHPLSALVKGWIGLAAVAYFVLKEIVNGETDVRGYGGLVLILVIVFGFVLPAVVGFITWLSVRFIIDNEQIRIEETFITKRVQRIAFSKVQSVDIDQPFVARLLRLASLHIDVGEGSGSKKLEFLTLKRAHELRDLIMSRAYGAPSTTEPTDERTVVAVPVGRLIASILLRTGMIIGLGIATVVIIISVVGDNLGWAAIPGVMLPVVLGLGSTLGSRVKNGFNFRLTTSPTRGVSTSSGLTTVKSQSIPAHRIQGLVIRQPMLWRLVGWYEVEIEVLGKLLGENGGVTNSTLLPVGDTSEVRAALATVWPTLDLAAIEMHPIPKRARRFRWFDAHTFAWGLDDEVIVSRGGLFIHEQSIVPHARVQSVRLHQGPLQRLNGLASVQAHTVAGPVDLDCEHLDAVVARRLVMNELDLMRAARARSPRPGAREGSPRPVVEDTDFTQGAQISRLVTGVDPFDVSTNGGGSGEGGVTCRHEDEGERR